MLIDGKFNIGFNWRPFYLLMFIDCSKHDRSETSIFVFSVHVDRLVEN